MKQVTQTLRTGLVEVSNVPVPTLRDKFLLVCNTASVISAGTEKTKIDMGNKNLFQKSKARPDLVKQVINKLRTEGVLKTIKTVNTRLNSPSPLGYSSAGVVVAVGGLVEGIKPGDRVACAGAGYANHAEFVAIPKNLAAKVPANVTDEEAAFSTLGAIALQGVRLSKPELGETFLVLGLGVLGQITVQLLRANGCNVIGTDLDSALVHRIGEFGAQGIENQVDIQKACMEITGERGVDGVLVCAGTNSNQPIELCGQVTREKGRVVVVGAVSMDIPRENYFMKEINVVISRSYGPGRYDSSYEEAGNDYPFGYVRFTEQRNMESFLELVSQGKVDVKNLISHRFPLEQAASAYKLIEGGKTEPYLGIVLQYSSQPEKTVEDGRIGVRDHAATSGKIKLSVFGAGNYATASLLPLLKDKPDLDFRGLVTASGRTAQSVANQFGFSFCASNFSELLEMDTDVVMIASHHDTHASSVIAAIEANKHVYVEKPLALDMEELAAIHKACQVNNRSHLMVGFNRRFAPLTQKVIEHFSVVNSPLVINIRVNAGKIDPDHWVNDPMVGGGRFIGEGCHFVDLASAITNSIPTRVYAVCSNKPDKSVLLSDNLSVSLSFEDGSIASIVYTADGSNAMQKEYVEVFGGGRSAIINDFKDAIFYEGDRKINRQRLARQDKGQKAMLDSWIQSLETGKTCISYDTLIKTSMATILVMESITINQPMDVNLDVLDQDT